MMLPLHMPSIKSNASSFSLQGNFHVSFPQLAWRQHHNIITVCARKLRKCETTFGSCNTTTNNFHTQNPNLSLWMYTWPTQPEWPVTAWSEENWFSLYIPPDESWIGIRICGYPSWHILLKIRDILLQLKDSKWVVNWLSIHEGSYKINFSCNICSSSTVGRRPKHPCAEENWLIRVITRFLFSHVLFINYSIFRISKKDRLSNKNAVRTI
jgi:hypothetical protein